MYQRATTSLSSWARQWHALCTHKLLNTKVSELHMQLLNVEIQHCSDPEGKHTVHNCHVTQKPTFGGIITFLCERQVRCFQSAFNVLFFLPLPTQTDSQDGVKEWSGATAIVTVQATLRCCCRLKVYILTADTSPDKLYQRKCSRKWTGCIKQTNILGGKHTDYDKPFQSHQHSHNCDKTSYIVKQKLCAFLRAGDSHI